MKLEPRRIESFLAAPDPTTRACLVYGPDRGLVGERVARLARAIVPDPKDAFQVAALSADVLLAAPTPDPSTAKVACELEGLLPPVPGAAVWDLAKLNDTQLEQLAQLAAALISERVDVALRWMPRSARLKVKVTFSV